MIVMTNIITKTLFGADYIKIQPTFLSAAETKINYNIAK